MPALITPIQAILDEQHELFTIPEEKQEVSHSSDVIAVYVDGSCMFNGTKDSKAAYGVWFGEDDPRNVSKSVPSSSRQTNNVAELYAIMEAITITRYYTSPVLIKSDSQYAVNCVTSWYAGFVGRKWKNVQNQFLIKWIREALTSCPHIVLTWIPRGSEPGHVKADAISRMH